MRWRDAAAAILFAGSFFASWITELACGPDSASCTLVWPASDPDDLNVNSYHCVPEPVVDRGLGDPALTVSSLLFTAALPYVFFDKRFSVLPIVATFLGIASFLFHARPTVIHHRLDIYGCGLLAPALFDAAAAAPKAERPIWDIPKPGNLFRAIAFVAAVIVILVGSPPGPFGAAFWTITILYGILFLMAATRVFSVRTAFVPTVFLVIGVITLEVGNGPGFWACVPSQLGEPHYWGHFFVAAGVVLVARNIGREVESDDFDISANLLGTGAYVDGDTEGWPLSPYSVIFFILIAAGAVASTAVLTAGILVVVAVGIHFLIIILPPYSGPRYSKQCTYRTRHIVVDVLMTLSLGLGAGTIAAPHLGIAMVVVAIVAGFIADFMSITEPNQCDKAGTEADWYVRFTQETP